MAAKKPFKANKKRPQIKKVRKTIRNTKAKLRKTKPRHFHRQQDNDEDKQQSLTYKSASSKPMNQFVKIEQFNALANNMSKFIEAANKIQDRIISMDAKLDLLITMFQRNDQTIAPDVM